MRGATTLRKAPPVKMEIKGERAVNRGKLVLFDPGVAGCSWVMVF